MAFTNEQIAKLEAKLDPNHVKVPTSSFGPKGDYLEGWHVINEANRVFGFDGWSYAIDNLSICAEPYQNEKENWVVSYTCVIKLKVSGAVRMDVGFGSGFSKQIGDAHESATKEAVTDALKRSLRTFGNIFGLALYDKTRANVGVPDPEKTPNEKMKDFMELLPQYKRMSVFMEAKQWAKDNLKPHITEEDWVFVEAAMQKTYDRIDTAQSGG